MNGNGPVVRVLVVDDHPSVRAALFSLLQSSQRVAVCGQARDAAEAVALADAHRPDVVVMDLRLAGECGIDATRTICASSPRTRVLVLSSTHDDRAVLQSIAAGASGFLIKQGDSSQLVDAVLALADGHAVLDHEVTQVVLERLRNLLRVAPAG